MTEKFETAAGMTELPREDLPKFGELLKQWREAWKLSQLELAYALNCDHSQISRLERGNRRPSYEAVDAIAVFFGVTPTCRDELLVAAGFPEEDVVTISKRHEPEIAEAVTLMQSGTLSPEDDKRAQEMLRVIIKLGAVAVASTLQPGSEQE